MFLCLFACSEIYTKKQGLQFKPVNTSWLKSQSHILGGRGDRKEEEVTSKSFAICHTFAIKILRNLGDQWKQFLEVRQHVKPRVIG